MDVLQYWRPLLDWATFKQGEVSDRMWSGFRAVVELAHAREHWRQAAYEMRLRPPGAPLYPESKYMQGKRRDEWRREISRAEGHMHRAGFLADESIANMSYLIGEADKGKPDYKLWWALRLTVGQRHESADWVKLAFNSFDAAHELVAEPDAIASRWLGKS